MFPGRPDGSTIVEDPFVFNGVDGATGSYLTEALSAEQVSALARGAPLDAADLRELEERHRRDTVERLGPREGVDPRDLASAGWGVIFPHELPPGVKEALGELLAHRRAGARDHYFKEYSGPGAYRPGETKRAFLARHGAAAGMPADPDKVPYYLLLVGRPEAIPYSFQYQLDVEYAVGRLWFERPDGLPDLDAFARYARSVVEAENGRLALPRRAAFVGVRNRDDPATALTAAHLVRPLADRLAGQRPGWEFQTSVEEGAGKADLAALLGGPGAPALLFTACHGMGFPSGDPRQLPHQGALLCQDWPGPVRWGQKPIPPGHYLAADDVGDGARLLGLVAFHFACYAAGTPRLDDFAHLGQLTGQDTIAPRPFVARLPQRLLGHPSGGALAVIGQVERAWSCSFHGGAKLGRQLQAFESTLLRLLDGSPVGHAMEYFNQLYAALSTELSKELGDVGYGKVPDDRELSSLWTSNNDARSYLVLGDPAVRLPVAASAAAPEVRPALEPVTALTPSAPQPTPAAPVRIEAVYEDREGYDPEFLGGLTLPLPGLSPAQEADAARARDPEPGAGPYELKYHHFSVVMNRRRRLAFFAAANIDRRLALPAGPAPNGWAFDPRIGRDEQAGGELYGGGPFGPGQLVRRLDPAWGRARWVARAASADTFHWTNGAPLHWRFSEGKNLWPGMEDYLLDRAAGERGRLTVLTGPVFEADDPVHREVRIPRRFWKVAVVARPAALAFVVSQEALLREVDPSGPARTVQVPVRQVQEMTGLDFGPLAELDAGGSMVRELAALEDVRLPPAP